MQFEKRVLLERLPRNADVQAADFDGDRDLDLVVASYGFRKLGSTRYYENVTTDWKEPKFVGHTIDARPGAIHVPPVDLNVDLNKDGRMDFLVLVSQQYEHLRAGRLAQPGAGRLVRGAGQRDRPALPPRLQPHGLAGDGERPLERSGLAA